MKIIYGIKNIRKFKKAVVAIGVFDGVHIGHRRILEACVKKARRIKGTSVVLTFWPHPQEEKSINSLEHRLNLIAELGVDACVVINFNKQFSQVSAIDFVKDILVEGIGAKCIYVGGNFRFGKAQEADCGALKELGRIYDFSVKSFRVLKAAKKIISSTYIRGLIKNGALKKAEQLLGRPVSVFGTVVRGISFGRKLGFPTANIQPHHEIIPPKGVYASEVIFNNKRFISACYIGPDPVFLNKRIKARNKEIKGVIEVFIFGFKKNIYGKKLEVLFGRKIREPKKFYNQLDLLKQIKKDILLIK